MLIAVVMAGALIAGVHPAAVGIVALALLQPVWFLVAVAGWGAWTAWQRSRSRGAGSEEEEAAFLQGLSAELEAGASLRAAVQAAAGRAPDLNLQGAIRVAGAGLPADDIASELESALPLNGRLAAGAVRLAGATGAPTSRVVGSLAVRAVEFAELRRERSVLTAQARLSAWIVGGGPVAVVGFLFFTGGFELSGPAGMLTAAGLVLEILGAAVVWQMLRASNR